MSSGIRTTLTILLSTTIALSIALLGLSARHLAFVQNVQQDNRQIFDLSVAWSPGSTSPSAMWYRPQNFTMQDTNAKLVAGILGLTIGGLILFLDLWNSDASMGVSITGRKVRNVRFARLPVALALNGILVAIFAAAVGSAWYQYHKIGNQFFDIASLMPDRGVLRYSRSSQIWNVEAWSCILADKIAPGQSSISTPLLQSLCKEAKATRFMVVPALILAGVALGLHFWAWRADNVAVRQLRDAAPPYSEVVAKQADLETLSERSVRPSELSPVSPVDSTEYMGGYRHGWVRAEMPDAAVKEMMGDLGQKEMEGGAVAFEKSADEKRG